MWLAMALFGTIGVFSVFDGFAEDDVQAGWAGVWSSSGSSCCLFCINAKGFGG